VRDDERVERRGGKQPIQAISRTGTLQLLAKQAYERISIRDGAVGVLTFERSDICRSYRRGIGLLVELHEVADRGPQQHLQRYRTEIHQFETALRWPIASR
jgi:hypothetical protein